MRGLIKGAKMKIHYIATIFMRKILVRIFPKISP